MQKTTPMFKNFVFVLISLFFFEGFSFTHAEDAHKEWLKQVLDIAQSQIIFSTTYEHEVKKNEEIIEEIDQIVTNALALYGEDLAFKIPCIRLLYIQGNYYLYKDRPILAQNKLLLAKNLCEKELSLKVIADDLLLFKSLSEQNLHLPSMYALILHLLGKALIYPKDPLNTPFHQKGFELIQKSILWRNLIDEHVSELNDDFDNNLIVGNTHIFKRTLGCAYLEREQWEEALEIFLECLQVQDSLNQIICLKNLVKIYQKKGKTASSPLLQNTYFQQGYLACTKLLNLIAVFPTIHRESVFFCIIGDFLADPATPFFDQEMACQCYKIAKKACHSSLKFLIKWSNEGLFNVLSDTLHQDNFLEAWQNYRENSCFDLLKRSLDDREFIEIFQEFGVIHQEKKNFIIASVFFTNAMSLAKKINFPSDFIEYRQYQLSKYFNATLTFDNYQWNLKKYKSLLDKLRNDLKNLKKRDVNFLQNLICNRIFQLLNEILNDFPGVDILKEDFALIAGGSLARKTMTPFQTLS